MKQISRTALVLGATLCMFAIGLALTLAKATLAELVSESILIVHGTVVQQESRWENSSHTAIETAVKFRVQEYLKGNGPQEIEFTQMGGRIGDFGDVVPGTPRLYPGQELVLFLQQFEGKYQIHSIALGCFYVQVKEDGRKYVISDLRDINLVDPITGKKVSEEEALQRYPLNDFLSRVRSLVQQQ